MNNTIEILGTAHGAIFEIERYQTNGFQLKVKNEKTGQVLFNRQMVFYTVPEAVHLASSEIFAEEIKETKFWELPSYILDALNLYFSEDDEE